MITFTKYSGDPVIPDGWPKRIFQPEQTPDAGAVTMTDAEYWTYMESLRPAFDAAMAAADAAKASNINGYLADRAKEFDDLAQGLVQLNAKIAAFPAASATLAQTREAVVELAKDLAFVAKTVVNLRPILTDLIKDYAERTNR